MPRFVPASALRRLAKSVRFTASRSTSRALQSAPSVWPVAVVSPGRSAFRSRSRDRVEAELLGNALHVHFDRELRLRRAEPAERAVWRRVRHHHAAADPDVIAAIRSRRMEHAAGQDDGAERRVGPAVEEHVDVHGRQSAVSRHAGAMPDHAGMTLRRRQHVFAAVVDELDRPARLQGRERRVAGNHRRILLLAAEAAAGFRLHDAYAVVGEAEQHGQRAMDVVRALHRSVHRDAPPVVGRHGNDPVGLDVELLLRADPVLAFDDLVGLGQAGVEIAFVDGDRLETEQATPTDRSWGRRRDTRCERRPPAADRDRRAPGSGWARRRDGSRAPRGTAGRRR